MSSPHDSDEEGGCFGDMFGAEDASSPPKADIEFVVDRTCWLAEGVPVPSEGTFDDAWRQAPNREDAHGSIYPLTLFQKDKHHSLWGHRIWNAAKYFSKRMDLGHIPVEGLAVLELGGGLGVPSLVAHQRGARVVVATDYPDDDLISILQKNVDANRMPSLGGNKPASVMRALPLLWGKREHMEACLDLVGSGTGFDVLILSDIVFNHVCHSDLLKTVAVCLAKDRRAAAYCAFSHHRPHKMIEDMQFFHKAAEFGLTWCKCDEEIYPLMFPDDPGPAEIRAPVHCFKLQHLFDAAGPPVDYNVDYDVVLQGTGVTETLLSAALSRHGLKVLHLDPEPAYGGVFNTLDAQAFNAFINDQFSDAAVAVDLLSQNAARPSTTATVGAPLSNEEHVDHSQGEGDKGGDVQPQEGGLPDALARSPYLRKRFQLDAQPMLYLSRGELIETLVNSEGARNMEFQNVDRIVLLELRGAATTLDGIKLHRIPLSRSDVFASNAFSPMEMRRLMKFVKDVEATLAEREHATANEPSSTIGDAAAPSEQFLPFLRRKYQLSTKSVNLLTLFGLLQDEGLTLGAVPSSVALMRTFLTSVGRFGGQTPFLTANYGTAELPQNMCRMSAVWNGTFILRRHVAATWRDDRKAYVLLGNGQRIEAKAVVTSAGPSDTNADATADVPPKFARCVVVLRAPLIAWSDLQAQLQDTPEDDADEQLRAHVPPSVLAVGAVAKCGSSEAGVAFRPATLEDADVEPVQVQQLGSASMLAPPGQHVVVHFTVDARKCTLETLNRFVDSAIAAKGFQESRDVWYRSSFTIDGSAISTKSSPTVGCPQFGSAGHDSEAPAVDSIPQDHVFRVKQLLPGIDDGAYVREAKRAFGSIVRHCKTFGIDPWSRCPFPGTTATPGADTADAQPADATAVASDEAPLFLPPPPEEVTMQMGTIEETDEDASILADAARRLRSDAPPPTQDD